MMAETDILVVGAGPAGLACARRLCAAGRKVLVLEAQPSPGGNVQSQRREGFLLERGPHTFLPSADEVLEAARAAGLGEDLIESQGASRRRYIVRGGRLRRVFSGPFSFLASRLLSARGKMTLLGEVFRTRERGNPGDTAEMFFNRRFGTEAARVLAGAFIGGVYAGDPARLSAAAAFPLFWRFEQQHGSMIRGAYHHLRARRAERRARGETRRRRGLCSFGAGLGQFTVALAAGLDLKLSAAVHALATERAGWRVEGEFGQVRARRLVLAVPPPQAAGLLQPLDREISQALAGIELAPVAVVYLGYRKRQERVPDGFGFLAPRGEGVRLLGVLFPARLFPGRAPDGGDLFTAYLGGMLDRDVLRLDDARLVELVLEDFRTLGRKIEPPDLVEVRRVEGAIPQLELGHLERLALVSRRLEQMPGLLLAGNYLSGVGLKDAVASGHRAAAQILDGAGGGS